MKILLRLTLDRPLRHDERLGDAALLRPSAINARISSSRGVRVSSWLSSRCHRDFNSRSTTAGSITEPPPAISRTATICVIRDPAFQQIRAVIRAIDAVRVLEPALDALRGEILVLAQNDANRHRNIIAGPHRCARTSCVMGRVTYPYVLRRAFPSARPDSSATDLPPQRRAGRWRGG